MKINQNTRITGHLTVLVPYRSQHVPKYHEWMQDPRLQELTASEPLSLEDEYAMQKSWRDDDDKCTFIVLDKEIWDNENNEIESMIGDVNLFFNNQDGPKEAEVEVMIAEKSKQQQGRGKECLLMMLRYGATVLGVKKFVAKIKSSNTRSLHLFEKIGFKKVSESHIFQEVTLTCPVTASWTNDLMTWTSCYQIHKTVSES